MFRSFKGVVVLIVLFSFDAYDASEAHATVYYWDTNGTTLGGGNPATGNWGADYLNWNTSPDYSCVRELMSPLEHLSR